MSNASHTMSSAPKSLESKATSKFPEATLEHGMEDRVRDHIAISVITMTSEDGHGSRVCSETDSDLIDCKLKEDLLSAVNDITRSSSRPTSITVEMTSDSEEDGNVSSDESEGDDFKLKLVFDLQKGEKGYIDAVIDTGACANFITEDLVEKLQKRITPKPHKSTIMAFERVNGKLEIQPTTKVRTFDQDYFEIRHKVHLSFLIGTKNRMCINIPFEVLEKTHVMDPKTAGKAAKELAHELPNSMTKNPMNDDVCSMLLGAPFLRQFEILVINKQFDLNVGSQYDSLEELEHESENRRGCYLLRSSGKHTGDRPKTVYRPSPDPN